ncbi:MAG TPA: head-tail connector protein [Allosphingosinicella sp.]
MIEGEALVLPPEAAGAAKDYLRVERADEDSLIAGLVLAAAELCEAFIGRPLVERGFTETISAGRAWRRLGNGPVRAILGVEALAAEGPAQALPSADYGIDIDSRGDGWVRLTATGEPRRVRVGYRAGLAGAWAELPAALRQGILRLAAHFYTSRAAEGARGGEPPAAVAALWRPFRRLRLR